MFEQAAPARLAHPQGVLGALALRDVDRERPIKRHAPDDRRFNEIELNPDNTAILAPVALLDARRIGHPRGVRRNERLAGAAVLLMRDVYRRKLPKFRRGIAGHFPEGRIPLDITLMRPHQGDTNRDMFEQAAPARLAHPYRGLAVPQGVLGALALRDVDRDRRMKRRVPLDRHQKDADVRPDYAAILAPVALLDARRIGHPRGARRGARLGGGAVVLMRDVRGREMLKLRVGIAGHFPEGRIALDITPMRPH